MNSFEHSTEKGTLYIDIDGVILPYRDEDGSNQHSQNLEKHWVDDLEFYYPKVIHQLARLPARKVLASSRGWSFLVNSEYRALNEELHYAGSLSIDAFRPGHIPFKFQAVVKHWLGNSEVAWSRLPKEKTRAIGSKAVWIDDYADVEKFPEIAEHPLLSDPRFLVIQPLGKLGITLEQVHRIAAFLEEE